MVWSSRFREFLSSTKIDARFVISKKKNSFIFRCLAYYLTISNPTELDITLHRKISKHLRIQRSDVSLCIAIISMEEQSNGNYRIYSIPIVSPRGQHKFISTDGQLQPGIYVILPILFNPINKYLDNTEFTIGLWCSNSKIYKNLFLIFSHS